MKSNASFLGALGLLVLSACSSSPSNGSGSPPFSQGGTANISAGAGGMSSVSAGAPGTTQSGAGTAGAITSTGGASTGTGGASGAAGAVTTAGAGGTTAAGGMSGAGGGTFTVPTATWPSAACQTKTAGLLAMMTKAEKAAQMVMAGNEPTNNVYPLPTNNEVQTIAPGAVFMPGGAPPPGGPTVANFSTLIDGYIDAASKSRLQIPILYGIDAVHGMSPAQGTVIFPHNIGLGATGDAALVEQVAHAAAQEVAATGVTWTFGPVDSVSFDDRWGREYESFSEDPTLTGLLSAAAVVGLQGATGLGSGKPGIVACAKHWAGDGQAKAGTSKKGGVVDRGDIQIDETAMRKYGIAPYLQAIQAGLGSIMVSDATWNGASLTSSKHMIVDLLKTEFAFKGFVATDWNAADTGGGVVNVVNAGVDMLMQPHDWKGTITLIQNGVADVRMNDAVTRILNVKCEAGLFGYKRDTSLASSVGSAEHRAIARKAVQESMVLLQNTNKVLPLAKTSKVFVTGSGADSLVNQCGGWTIAWQGGGENTGTTIKAAIAKVAAPVATQAEADVVVVVLSETPYAEFLGDVSTLNKFLGPNDLKAVDDAHAAGKKVVAIVLSGRPLVIADHLANADAWIAAWLPGTEGDGVADILYGTATPSGKLSHSWPKTDAQANVNIGDPGYDPLFKLGFGLTY